MTTLVIEDGSVGSSPFNGGLKRCNISLIAAGLNFDQQVIAEFSSGYPSGTLQFAASLVKSEVGKQIAVDMKGIFSK